jgi:hypothetical protein
MTVMSTAITRVPEQNDTNVGGGLEAMTSKPELVSFLGSTRSPSDDRRTRPASQSQHSFRESSIATKTTVIATAPIRATRTCPASTATSDFLRAPLPRIGTNMCASWLVLRRLSKVCSVRD